MRTTHENTRTLESLLRGELAAIETYRQALEKVADDPRATELRRLEREHREAADVLRKHIVDRAGEADTTSGAWGAFAKAVEGASKLFGTTAALKALKEGEEHGVKEYEEALLDEHLDLECKSLIRNTQLPQQRTHIVILDRLIASA